MLDNILLVFCGKHEDEGWKERKLELLFAPINGGPSTFVSMMQIYLNLTFNMFEFSMNNPDKSGLNNPQLWIRRGALEACFRLLEIARTCPHSPQEIFKFAVIPLFESNLFQWVAATLTEKLGNQAILEKDVFFYLSADLVCASVRTYATVA